MGAAVVAFLLCILNVILWIILFIKFKDIFSTKRTLEETHEALNSMLISINRNADRNITLLEEKIREVKAVTEEAEKRIALMKSEVSKTNRANEFRCRLENIVPDSKTSRQSEPKVESSHLSESPVSGENEFRGQENNDSVLRNNEIEDISVIKKKSPVLMYQTEQSRGRLYQNEVSEKKSEMIGDNKNVGSKSAGIPEIVESQDKIVVKKNLKDQVKELSRYGFSIEEIATKLGVSTQEIEFSLEF